MGNIATIEYVSQLLNRAYSVESICRMVPEMRPSLVASLRQFLIPPFSEERKRLAKLTRSPKPEIAECRKLLTNGVPRDEILKRIPGLRYNQVFYQAKLMGIATAKLPTGRTQRDKGYFERVKKIRTMKEVGKTYQQIGDALGISRQRAQQLLSPNYNSEINLADKHCEKCGAKVKLHCHHEDYIKDTIKILCVSCHRKRHWRKK